MKTKQTLTGLAAATLVAAACLSAGVAQARSIIKIDGSSTVYPITEAVAEEYQKTKRGAVMVTVGISGTGGGFKKFCRGETDIANASRPILKSEREACRAAGVQYLELPVAYDAITVVVNPRNDWVASLTVEQLKKIWEPAAHRKVTRWNEVDPKWPDARLSLFGPGPDSGTFDYFTEAVAGKAKASRGDYTASEDDNVLVQGVSRDRNALGYFGFAYYAENRDKLKAVAIDSGKGPVMPSVETVMNGTYSPLSRPIFIYVNAGSLGRPEIKEFVEFYLDNAMTLVKEVKYVPLPASAYRIALEHVRKKKLGTVFDGEAAVGLKIEELLAREARL